MHLGRPLFGHLVKLRPQRNGADKASQPMDGWESRKDGQKSQAMMLRICRATIHSLRCLHHKEAVATILHSLVSQNLAQLR